MVKNIQNLRSFKFQRTHRPIPILRELGQLVITKVGNCGQLSRSPGSMVCPELEPQLFQSTEFADRVGTGDGHVSGLYAVGAKAHFCLLANIFGGRVVAARDRSLQADKQGLPEVAPGEGDLRGLEGRDAVPEGSVGVHAGWVANLVRAHQEDD